MPILLIENQASRRRDILSMLRSRGHRVVTADEGSEAIELLRHSLFDLIITSLMAGRMRVVEFAIAAKNLQPKTSIIAVGGYFGRDPTIPFVDVVVQHPVSMQNINLVVGILLPMRPGQGCGRMHTFGSYLRRGSVRPARCKKKSGAS